MSRWFRLYADAMRNPKVARLSDADFRLWVRLLAVASENDGKIPPASDLKHLLNMRLDYLSKALERLFNGGLMDPLEAGYEPHNWSKFQYKSDTSTERVHKFREKRNVSVTPPDTEADTDTELTVAKATVLRARKTQLPDDWAPARLDRGTVSGQIVQTRGADWCQRTLESFSGHWRGTGTPMKDWQQTWAKWVIEQDRRDGRNGRQPNGFDRNEIQNPMLRAAIRSAEARESGG